MPVLLLFDKFCASSCVSMLIQSMASNLRIHSNFYDEIPYYETHISQVSFITSRQPSSSYREMVFKFIRDSPGRGAEMTRGFLRSQNVLAYLFLTSSCRFQVQIVVVHKHSAHRQGSVRRCQPSPVGPQRPGIQFNGL